MTKKGRESATADTFADAPPVTDLMLARCRLRHNTRNREPPASPAGPRLGTDDRLRYGTVRTKLRPWQVRIRKRRHPAKVYAERFKVNRQTVYDVLNGRTWRHLDGGMN